MGIRKGPPIMRRAKTLLGTILALNDKCGGFVPVFVREPKNTRNPCGLERGACDGTRYRHEQDRPKRLVHVVEVCEVGDHRKEEERSDPHNEQQRSGQTKNSCCHLQYIERRGFSPAQLPKVTEPVPFDDEGRNEA